MPIDERDPERRRRIGGSEASVPFDLNPYVDRFGLWARKHGEIPPDPASDRMRLGKHLEQGIASYAAELQGWEYVWSDKTLHSPDYPFMTLTPDALMPGKLEGIDCKLVSWDQKHLWAGEQPPDHVTIQSWWYLAGLDYTRWWVVALVEGEHRPRIYPVERDARAEKVMLRRNEEFWLRYIIGEERPPITASGHADRWLKHKFPRPLSERIARAKDEEADMLADYAEVRDGWDHADTRRRDLEAQIKAAIGDRAGLKWPGGQFTWKLSKDSYPVKWEALAETLLATHPAAEALKKEFTETKPGVRRIHYTDRRGVERPIE